MYSILDRAKQNAAGGCGAGLVHRKARLETAIPLTDYPIDERSWLDGVVTVNQFVNGLVIHARPAQVSDLLADERVHVDGLIPRTFGIYFGLSHLGLEFVQ